MKNRRNYEIVGNNSASYNDKHPTNPIELHPIRRAIANTPKIADGKGGLHPDYAHIHYLRGMGGRSGKQEILANIHFYSDPLLKTLFS